VSAVISGEVEVEVFDRDGRVLQRGRHPMRSLLANFVRALNGLAKASGGASPTVSTVYASAPVVDVNGSTQSIYTEWYKGYGTSNGTPLALKAGDNDDSYGIVVGSGTRPVAINDYSLASKISHGSGSGQLDYDPTTAFISVDTSVSPPVAYIVISRVFNNVSDSPITISEVGLVARSYWFLTTSTGAPVTDQDVKYLIARDVLPTQYTVPPNASANVRITIKVVLG